MTTGDAVNMTHEPHTHQVMLSCEETKSRAWKGSVSLNLGVEVTMESSVPFIADGKVEISSEFSGVYEWGETESVTTTMEAVRDVYCASND